jgi:hypothetical protein
VSENSETIKEVHTQDSSRTTMGKARVGIKLKEAVGGKKSLNKSADLEQNKERFNTFTKKLKGLIISLKAHYASMAQLSKTRLEVRSLGTVDVRAACDFAIADDGSFKMYISVKIFFDHE